MPLKRKDLKKAEEESMLRVELVMAAELKLSESLVSVVWLAPLGSS